MAELKPGIIFLVPDEFCVEWIVAVIGVVHTDKKFSPSPFESIVKTKSNIKSVKRWEFCIVLFRKYHHGPSQVDSDIDRLGIVIARQIGPVDNKLRKFRQPVGKRGLEAVCPVESKRELTSQIEVCKFPV